MALAIVRDRLLDVSLFGQRLAQVHISFDQVRTKRDGGAIAAFGFDVFSLRREDDAEIVARLREIGLERKRPLVGLRRLVQPLPLGKHIGPIVMCLHGSGIERDHALVAGERHIGLALFPDGVAEVHVGLGIVRLECDGLAIVRDGVIHATEGVQCQAQVVLPLRNIVVQGDRFADHVGGDVGPPDLNPDQPGVVQAADVLGLDSQDVTIEAVRISELAGLMMLYCLREQPIDVARRDIHVDAPPTTPEAAARQARWTSWSRHRAVIRRIWPSHQSIGASPKESGLASTEAIGRCNGFVGRQFAVREDKSALPSRFLS